jgi:hypothetical protein
MPPGDCDTRRLIHLHRNVPGIPGAINRVHLVAL